MQMELIAHRIGDFTGAVWSGATAPRPDGGERAVIIRSGCGVILSSASPTTAGLTITVPFMSSRVARVGSFIDIARPTMKRISYSFHMGWQRRDGGGGRLLLPPRTCVGFFNDTLTRVEPCINARSDSWWLVGSSGLNVRPHMKEVTLGEETLDCGKRSEQTRSASPLDI